MDAANSDLEVWLRFPAFFHGPFHQQADTFLIKSFKRIITPDTVGQIIVEELSAIISRNSKGGLGQIISAKGKEFSFPGYFISGQSRSWYFDHGTNFIFDSDFILFHHLSSHPIDNFFLIGQFGDITNQRNHDFGQNFLTLRNQLTSCLQNGLSLHFSYFRISYTQAAPTMAEHRIKF